MFEEKEGSIDPKVSDKNRRKEDPDVKYLLE